MSATTTMRAADEEALRRFPLFERLPQAALAALAASARRLELPAGTVVMEEGSEGDGLYLLLEGRLEVSRRSSGDDVTLGVYGPGIFLGELSLLEHAPRSATVRTVEPSTLLVLPPAAFEALLAEQPAVSLELLRTVMARLRSTESAMAQHARLVSLGTLAAGLAHEINNPAAALRRGLVQLEALFDELGDATLAIDTGGTLARQTAPFGSCMNATPPRPGSPAERAAEDRLTVWLVARGVPAARDLAPRLLAGGWSPESLDRALDGLSPAVADAVLHWIGVRCAAHALLAELGVSARAITDVVAAVREHAAPGRRGPGRHDVAEGIANALLMLRSRIGPGVSVVRRIPPDLPPVRSWGNELGQLWTNLLDNAIDAVGDGGTIDIRADADEHALHVEIADDGPGIPDDIRDRIFDPFFTTRPAGTGLGLHIVQTIVRRHHGTIHLQSSPGRTIIRVDLPRHPAGPDTVE